jgi:hypothetical protein
MCGSGVDGGTDGDAGDGGDGSDASDVAMDVPFNCDRCVDGGICDIDANRCVVCLSNTHCAGGGANVCDIDANRCVECLSSTHCGDGGANVCDIDANRCIECLADSDCLAKSRTKPLCQSQTCRACRSDNECPSPNICMTDGHCATSDEVIFVEFSSSGCPDANGSTDKPYCAPSDALARLVSGKNVIVIRGPTADRLTLNTTGVMPVVIGRRGGGNAPASIPATAATAIQVLSDTVLIRDLEVTGGTATTSKGIVVSGAQTSLTLSNTRVTLVTGLGIQADGGAQLTMDRCTVTKNSAGGLLINGAGYDIQNGIFAENGFSQLQFSSTPNPGTPSFRFNTVVATTGNAATCDVNNKRPLSDSIIVGGQNCTLVNSLTTATFRTASDFHIAARAACPETPAAPLPAHDIDGEPRTSPLDCGADQLAP